MSKATLTQFSFNRGELDPALHGRSDWKYYFSGAERLLNIVTRPQGGATKRGGLRLVAPALDDERPSVLIPFRFSVRQSYMLEFGDKKMRILKDGAVVTLPGTGREAVIETPYPYSTLSRLRYAQTADVMILTHPEYPPRRLSRHDHHDWRFSRLMSDGTLPTPTGLRVNVSGEDGAKYVVTAVTLDEEESGPSDAVTAFKGVQANVPGSGDTFFTLYDWLYEQDASRIPEHLAFHTFTLTRLLSFLLDCGYQDRGMRYGSGDEFWQHVKPGGKTVEEVWLWENNYSRVIRECVYACDMGWAGNVRAQIEAAINEYVDEYTVGQPGSRITTIGWQPSAGAVRYRIYRERSADGETGFYRIGETDAVIFTDDNHPATDVPIPTRSDMFTGVGDYPGVCAFFEQRLVLGRSDNKPTTFWGSDTGQYNSFGKHTPIEDTDSYEFTLANGEMNEINWIVPLNDMLLGTTGGEWKAGGGGSAITPSNVNARVQSWYGCGAMTPVVVGRTVIFSGRNRRTIRSFSYSLEADGYAGRDLAAYARHLFTGREIVCMCYQQEPSGIVWAVLSDGGLLSCTYAPEEDVVSWSRHETQGKFEYCGALVDVDGSDQVYFCVTREVGGIVRRFIETMEDAADQTENESDGFFLDAGLSYRGRPVNRVRGLEHLEGESVHCLADGNVFENLTVSDGAVTLPDGFEASVVHVGLPYRAEVVTLDMEPEGKETIHNRARFAVAATMRFYNCRECLYSHSDGALSEIKFRTTELPGRPARVFTGEKNIVFSSPAGARTTRLRFVSDSPVPFTLLGVIVEASYGQPA